MKLVVAETNANAYITVLWPGETPANSHEDQRRSWSLSKGFKLKHISLFIQLIYTQQRNLKSILHTQWAVSTTEWITIRCFGDRYLVDTYSTDHWVGYHPTCRSTDEKVDYVHRQSDHVHGHWHGILFTLFSSCFLPCRILPPRLSIQSNLRIRMAKGTRKV